MRHSEGVATPLSASAEGSALFELMTAEVIAGLGGVRAGRAVAAATAAWRDRVLCRQAKSERAACAGTRQAQNTNFVVHSS